MWILVSLAGGSASRSGLDATHLDADRLDTAPPPMQTPLEADPSPSGFRPLQRQIPLEADPPGPVACDTCWEATHPREQNNTQV